ncbi:unnamed protein product [Candidula unifasciata]|uniref:Origin recognition complex subunit 3 N-terminal domain-containing protein n=1 Tax=Candidula unifasciata TaxID=100452 RepID=A0A8S3Z1M0_9EUPU|nr:unnamed protein product [Candidula unifasciata]
MSSDTISSVSKGCFAYKGKVARANREDYINVSNDKFIKSRFKLCNQLQEDLHIRIGILRSDLNSKIFDDLVAFAASYNATEDKYKGRSIEEILTAVLITGVNTPDHDIMFSNLDSMLKVKVTPLVARIKSTDCSRVATLIKNIFQQLANVSMPMDDEDDNGENSIEDCPDGDKNDLESSPVKLKWTD